ncbi:hypothetical protein [uncultured Aquimarina sp.]|uniref:hypothetical protein n=1 Tax=uncultured Aquimarina sp. TaxID=575652 RepID=UPI00262DC5BE|nr:hypothetical protein [uncultured Aquimarina sp.]
MKVLIERKPILNTSRLVLLFVLCSIGYSFSQDQREIEQKLRDSIHNEFINIYSDYIHYSKNGVTNFNGKTEFWKIYELQNENRIIQIESHSEGTYFQEIYFEKNGKLVYAKETQNYTPINSFEQMAWNCEFYIKDDKVITTMSLGHGKTEDEEWDENMIIEMYFKRLVEIEKIQQ